MSATNAFETDLLKLIFQNIALANIGDASGLQPSAAAGSFWISLHTADPGEAGDQGTSEATYTGYARVAVARTTGGFTVSGNQVSNAAIVAFGTCTAGSNSITHFGVGSSSSGAGNLRMSGALGAALAVSNLVTPSFAIGALTATAD
ncbi:MAG: hypothetical protein ABL951_06970 [Alphaproteobacteria bacterium]